MPAKFTRDIQPPLFWNNPGIWFLCYGVFTLYHAPFQETSHKIQVRYG